MPLGSIAAPTITPLRAPSASRPSFHIDPATYIEIETSNQLLCLLESEYTRNCL